MNILYGVCSWGLGHATRSLPIMRKLLEEDNSLTIISHGDSLNLLKKEIGENAKYFDIKDYPIPISERKGEFVAKSIVYWPIFMKRMRNGLVNLNKILRKKRYNLIISDGRYDIYSKSIPSFFISHQIRIMNPFRIRILEYGSEIFNLFFFKRFCGVIVPDYKTNDLSGDLSHNLRLIDEDKLHYVGVLSDFRKRNLKKDIDYLISLSGPEPQRTLLEKKLLSQIKEQKLDGKIVVTLGKTKAIGKKIDFSENVKIYSILSKDKREELLNRAKLIISRSGYSTIMDLAVIGTKALMIPTPGQIEQEYLAWYHNRKGSFYSVTQEKINLEKDVKEAFRRKGFINACDVDKTVDNIMDVIFSVNKSPF
jgi:uncharacterized protein (TIGR00661 family)